VVELALILPIVIALVLGTITGGIAYFRKITVLDSAREGARYGASLKIADYGTWQADVQARVAQISGGLITASQVCAALVVPTGSDTTCGVTDPAGASTDPIVNAPASIVKVSVSVPTSVQFFFFSQTVTLGSNVAARYERDII
jgi:Flp pilus assembly protein TadG